MDQKPPFLSQKPIFGGIGRTFRPFSIPFGQLFGNFFSIILLNFLKKKKNSNRKIPFKKRQNVLGLRVFKKINQLYNVPSDHS
jgi:hypothetical protein